MDIEVLHPAMREIADPQVPLVQIAHGTTFAEGPVWDRRNGCLYFTDIVEDTIWRWTPGIGKEMAVHPSGHADGMTIDHEGRLLVAGWASRSVWRREADGSLLPLVTHYQGTKINTPNDIVMHSSGAIYWTDGDGAFYIPGMESHDLQRYLDFNAVFRLSPDGRDLTPIITDFTFPNGLVFSPDEKLLYVNDTRQSLVRIFDVNADGSVSNGRIFYELQGAEIGHADGMKVDRKGNLYCTGPAGIHVISPEGTLLGRIKVPAECTNMAWGDEDWNSLYITTHHVIFRARLNIPGIPVGGCDGR
jgi:gluconolactonase